MMGLRLFKTSINYLVLDYRGARVLGVTWWSVR